MSKINLSQLADTLRLILSSTIHRLFFDVHLEINAFYFLSASSKNLILKPTVTEPEGAPLQHDPSDSRSQADCERPKNKRWQLDSLVANLAKVNRVISG